MKPRGTVQAVKNPVMVTKAEVLDQPAPGVLIGSEVAQQSVSYVGLNAHSKPNLGESAVNIDAGIVLSGVKYRVRLRLYFHKGPWAASSL